MVATTKRVTKKLMEKFIRSYIVRKIVSENAVELELLTSLRIHLVVNVRKIVKYTFLLKFFYLLPCIL